MQHAFLLLLFSLVPYCCLAEPDAPHVVVHIRTIKASIPKAIEQASVDGVSLKGSVSREIELDSRLDDLRSKLGQINFLSYRLLSEDELAVRMKRKQTLVLKDQSVLVVRPLYLEEDKVGMWLKWTDSSGEQVLLDTRMNFIAGDSMIAGTDSSGDCGVILAIKARLSSD